MKFTYDLNKDKLNRVIHKISLAEAARIDWSTSIEELDDREDYGEDRYKSFGFIENRLYCVVFVDQDEVRRIISLRKANAKELKDYARTNRKSLGDNRNC